MLLDNVKEKYPALVEEVVPKTLTLGDVQKVLASLIKRMFPSVTWSLFWKH